ncbi:MAG: hypothetical protein K2M88_07390 [Muribaculaceae bacterium]|nr:hypothetical protein [Muribaculaceae bacterium]
MKSYKEYRKDIIDILAKEVQEVLRDGKEIAPGNWQGKTGDQYTHILPLDGGKNTKAARRNAIHKYIGIEIDDKFLSKKGSLHQYAHHLNSSQLLCYMVFRPLLTDGYHPTKDMKTLLSSITKNLTNNINISEEAECEFEYSDHMMWKQESKPEGTSFDFYISDNGHEYFFEIKFTEHGFGKAKKDDEHERKFEDIYLKKIEDVLNKKVTLDEGLKYYQLFRNIIRGDSDKKTIVLITDDNNPSTKSELERFKKEYMTDSKVNIINLTWQEIYEQWPENVKRPFQFVCFKT